MSNIQSVMTMEESGEQCTLSSLHKKLLRIRLVRGPAILHPPSTHTHSLDGSVTINAKTTVHDSPGSSMVLTKSPTGTARGIRF
jgi:hypothetical protein